jgi:uncharacterized membrane protein YbjE (DUF340 family)
MKNSLIILSFFAAGLIIGIAGLTPPFIKDSDFTIYLLYALMFFVGSIVGSDRDTWQKIRKINIRIILAPLTVIFGTLGALTLFSTLIPGLSLKESLAIGSGFGYYSLSSVLISNIKGEMLGVIALAANITRELFTLICAPLLAKYFGKLAPIASGGATAMDTTLPVITRFSGKEYAIVGLFSGFVLTLLVPILVTFFIKL